MKKLLLSLVGSLALTGALQAGEQTLTVTPEALGAWTVTAADKSALSLASSLALPGGAQLSRRFDAELVTVQLNTPLVFGFAGEDFPTLEVGPAALVFSREGMAGQVVLVMGDTRSYPLPFSVKLNIDGSSISPVDVQLAYERGTGNVVVTGFGQTLRYVTEASARPVEVVISAGAHDALTLQNLTVRLLTPDDATDHAKGGTKNQPDSTARDGTGTGPGKKTPIIKLGAGNGGPPTSDPVLDKKPPANAGNPMLEVYTPAAVRHGRADAIRAAVVQGKRL